MRLSKKKDLPEKITNPGGETLQEVLGLVAGNVSSHSLAKVSIPPGNASSKHFHKSSEESYLILSGEATLEINNVVYELISGEAVLIEPSDIHQISNRSDDELIFIAVCVPAWSPDDSFDIKEN